MQGQAEKIEKDVYSVVLSVIAQGALLSRGLGTRLVAWPATWWPCNGLLFSESLSLSL